MPREGRKAAESLVRLQYVCVSEGGLSLVFRKSWHTHYHLLWHSQAMEIEEKGQFTNFQEVRLGWWKADSHLAELRVRCLCADGSFSETQQGWVGCRQGLC